MEDREIVELYWARDERAVGETQTKYGPYCMAVARRIVTDGEDAAECVNDALLAAWRSIPPQRPAALAAYLGKLTRRIALNRLRDGNREKRGGGRVTLALEELGECVPGGTDAGAEAELSELTGAIDRFLGTLPGTERDVFVCRYWFLASVEEICGQFGFGESRVKSMLSRTRKKLKRHLKEEGMI